MIIKSVLSEKLRVKEHLIYIHEGLLINLRVGALQMGCEHFEMQ